MNIQLRYTSVDAQENHLHMQAIQQQAEQDELARSLVDALPRHHPLHAAGHRAYWAAHAVWVVGDELAQELADMLHGHRPHLHHHAH